MAYYDFTRERPRPATDEMLREHRKGLTKQEADDGARLQDILATIPREELWSVLSKMLESRLLRWAPTPELRGIVDRYLHDPAQGFKILGEMGTEVQRIGLQVPENYKTEELRAARRVVELCGELEVIATSKRFPPHPKAWVLLGSLQGPGWSFADMCDDLTQIIG